MLRLRRSSRTRRGTGSRRRRAMRGGSLGHAPGANLKRPSVRSPLEPALFDLVLLPPPPAGPLVLAGGGGSSARPATARRVSAVVEAVGRRGGGAGVCPDSGARTAA